MTYLHRYVFSESLYCKLPTSRCLESYNSHVLRTEFCAFQYSLNSDSPPPKKILWEGSSPPDLEGHSSSQNMSEHSKKAYNLHDLENVLVSLICPHGNHHVKVQVKLAMIYKQPTLCLECTSYFISVTSLQAVRVARAPKLAVKIGERTFWIRVSLP